MSKPKMIRVVGAVLDKQQLLLYKEDGTTISVLQGDIRLQDLLDKVVPQINRQGWAEIKEESVNSYADFQQKTGIKLFRVAKSLVKSLFSSDADREHVDPNKPIKVGSVPEPKTTKVAAETAQAANQSAAINAVQADVAKAPEPKSQRRIPTLGEGLLTHARPVTENESPLQQDETIVAVVGDALVPGMEMLKGQMDHIRKGNSSEGMQNLLARLGKMIDQRGHSVEDILRFLERGDLPIADDGSIIAYKVLKSWGRNSLFERREALFFDCHSGQVPQQVGSVVCVDESLVDKNRRNECSNGLHIARRGYIGNFSGDVLVLCKIAPEDIITVPHNDPNKVRVCAYHIIAKISEMDHQTLRNNRAMTDNDEAQLLLGRALVGDHIGKIEEVRITEQLGGGIVIKKLVEMEGFNYIRSNDSEPPAEAEQKTAPAEAKVEPTPAPKAEPTKTASKKSKPKKAKALDLRDTKGVDLSGPKIDPKGLALKQAAVKKKTEKKKPATKPDKADVAAPKAAPVSKTPEAAKGTPKPMGRVAVAQDLYKRMMKSTSLEVRKASARELLTLKKAAKVSWNALGFNTQDVPAQIEMVINIPETAKAPAKAKSPVKVAKPKANATTAVPAAKSVKAPAKPVKAAVSAADLSEADVLRQVKDGKLSKADAARKLGTSPRSIDRKLAKLS